MFYFKGNKDDDKIMIKKWDFYHVMRLRQDNHPYSGGRMVISAHRKANMMTLKTGVF